MDHFKSNVAGYYKKTKWKIVRIIFERTSVGDELFLRLTIFQSKFRNESNVSFSASSTTADYVMLH